MNVFVVLPNTMMSFLNIRTASPPIQQAAAMEKYWMRQENAVHAIAFSVLLIPIRNARSSNKSAMQSCTWNLLASLLRSFLET